MKIQHAKNRFKVGWHDDSNSPVFAISIQNYGLVVKGICSESSNMGWLQQGAKTLCGALAFLGGTEPVSELTCSLLHSSGLYNICQCFLNFVNGNLVLTRIQLLTWTYQADFTIWEHLAVQGTRVGKSSASATIFSVKGKTTATPFDAKLLWGDTIAMITAYVQGQHMWLSQSPGSDSKCSKQQRSDVHIKPESSNQSVLDGRQNLTKIYHRDHSIVKEQVWHVSPLRLHWLAWCYAKWPSGCR